MTGGTSPGVSQGESSPGRIPTVAFLWEDFTSIVLKGAKGRNSSSTDLNPAVTRISLFFFFLLWFPFQRYHGTQTTQAICPNLPLASTTP